MCSLNLDLAIFLLHGFVIVALVMEKNRLRERCLQTIYVKKDSLFEMLLEKDDFVSVYNRNHQVLATEMYKIKNGLSPSIVTELFEQRNEQH